MAPSLLSSLVLLAATTLAAPVERAASAVPQKQGNVWVVQDAGSFTQHVSYTFSGSQLPSGLSKSTDAIDADGDAKAQQYTTANVYVSNNLLNMKVPGGQANKNTITGAQITTDNQIFYGSIRTVAKASSVAGTCHGFFSYNNDNLEETDIEILTANMTAVHYTNQNPRFSIDGGEREATQDGPMPKDATSAFHEYRTDWLPGKVRFYLDGAFQAEVDKYTPTTATPWVWNNWSNGDKGWSAGPPATDNVLQIQKIEMYYNTTSS